MIFIMASFEYILAPLLIIGGFTFPLTFIVGLLAGRSEWINGTIEPAARELRKRGV